MQTFLTQKRFGRTAADLDDTTLSMQMTQCMQIFDTLTGVTPDFQPEHPVMGMWEGYEYALGIYAMMLNLEWTFQRGFAHHECLRFFHQNIKEMHDQDPEFIYEVPPWLNDVAVIKSHRSNLVRRLRSQYEDRWKVAPDNWPVLWPKIDFTKPEGYTLWLAKGDKERLRKGERTLPPDDVMERVVNW